MASSPNSDRTVSDEEIPILERKKKLDRLRQEAGSSMRPGGGEAGDAGRSGQGAAELAVPKTPFKYKDFTIYPDGRSSCTEKSLRLLHRDCGVPEGVKFILPTKEQRADSPPSGCFTMYESFVRDCFLWFPIPETITEFLGYHRASFAQLTPRAVMHLVGIMVRSFEEVILLSQDHLFALLSFTKAGKSSGNVYYIANRSSEKRLITGFGSKENYWKHFFFYVPICEATVGTGAGFVHHSFAPIVNRHGGRLPDNFSTDFRKLQDGDLDWKTFSLKRVNAARKKAAGIAPEETTRKRPIGVVIGEHSAPRNTSGVAPLSKKEGKRPMSQVGSPLAKRKRAEEGNAGKKAAAPIRQEQASEPISFELERGSPEEDDELSRAAAFFSGIKFINVSVPSAEDMVCSRTFSRVAHASLEQNAEVTRMATVYESRIAKLKDRVAELEDQAVDGDLAARVEALEKENAQLRSENERLVASIAGKDEELGRQRAEVETAAWSTTKEADMIRQAQARLLRLRGEPLKNFILDRQNKANLTLIKEIIAEEKKAEGRKSLQAFEEEMIEFGKLFQAAGLILNKEFDLVLADLGTAPIPTDLTVEKRTEMEGDRTRGEASSSEEDSEESEEGESEEEQTKGDEDTQVD